MITNYGELKAEVADWINREDLTAKLPDFIRLAETEIYRDLRSADNEFTATYISTGADVDGVAMAPSDEPFNQLPPNFAYMSLVTWNDEPIQVVSSQRLTNSIKNGPFGYVHSFAITGRVIQFADKMADVADWTDEDKLVYVYYGTESLDSMPTWQVKGNPVETPAIPDENPQINTQPDTNTTRLLQRNPDLYLNGSMFYASLYLKDAGGISMWGSLFNKTLSDIKTENKNSKYSGGSKQVSAPGGYA
jgi:hypothetical protein